MLFFYLLLKNQIVYTFHIIPAMNENILFGIEEGTECSHL